MSAGTEESNVNIGSYRINRRPTAYIHGGFDVDDEIPASASSSSSVIDAIVKCICPCIPIRSSTRVRYSLPFYVICAVYLLSLLSISVLVADGIEAERASAQRHPQRIWTLGIQREDD